MGATVRYNNLTGGLNTVQGINTINQSVKRTESPEMYNVEYYKLGGLCTMEGNRLFGTPFNETVTLGYEYIYGNNKYMIVCTADGKVWRYNPLTNSYDNIYTFKTATQRHSICSFNNGIVMSNGVDDLVFYQYGRNQLLEGTITITQGSADIVGTNTQFSISLGVGDYITINGLEGKYRVESITDDTHLTLSEPLEFDATQHYYAYSDEENTYYTASDANANIITAYSITNETTISEVSSRASLVNNVLTIPTTTTQTVQGTRYEAWNQPTITSNTTWGTISGSLGSDAYTLFTNRTAPIYDSTITVTWTFPYEMELSSVSFDYWNANYNGTATIKAGNGVTLGSVSLPYNAPPVAYTNRNITFTATKTNSITITFNCPPRGALAIMNVNNIRLVGKQPVSYNYEETVVVNKTYNRDEASDKDLAVQLSNVSYYLSDISELNAVYVNEDDENVHHNVRGLALMSYQGRIFVGGNDGTLYYSEVGLIHGWDLKYGAGAIPTFYDDNSDFTALGLFDKYLVICKRERSYILDGTDVDDANWTINPYSDYTCDSQQSWLVANNMFLVYSRNAGGIYPLLQRTIYSPNYQGNELSVKIRDSFDNLSTSRYDYIFPVYNPKKKYIMFYMPMVSGNGSNNCFIFDIQTKTWLLRRVSQNVTVAFRFDNDIYIGTQDGLILKEFSGTTFNKDVIEWSWKSPWFSFGDGSNYLSTREFRINLSEDGANNFKIKTRRDGIDKELTRKINADSNNYIGLEWESKEDEESLTDTVWDEDSWTATKHTIKRFPLPNQYFQTIQIELCGNSTQESMNIYGFEFHGIQLEELPY